MMSKSDIVSTIINELIDKFAAEPELFSYKKDDYLAHIIWQTNPNNPISQIKTVILSWDTINKAVSVRIYNSVFNSNIHYSGAIPEAFIESSRFLEQFRSNHIRFCKLRKKIIAQHKFKETKEFLTKVSTVFPTIIDHLFLGK